MKEISRQIAYTWKKNDGSDIVDSHLDDLDKHASSFIGKQIEKGYVEGELYCIVDDSLYRGYWVIQNN